MIDTKFKHTLIGAVATFWGFLHLASEGLAQVQIVNETIETRLETEEASITLTKVVQGLNHPWAVGFLPDGSMLVTERSGKLYLVSGEKITQLKGLPKIDTDEDQLSAPDGGNQGGLLDIAVHPDYETNGWIYFTYSSPGDDDSVTGDHSHGTGTALARARIDSEKGKLTDLETLYAQVPRTNPGRHYGSRIVLPGDGTILFTIGDRGLRWNSQDLTDPAGSVIRLKEDGGAADDNPFIGVAPGNLRPEIYSYGHRNNQGMAIDPETGSIWATEHGPNGGDLLHLIEKGTNYGWPQVAFGTEYDTDEKIGLGQEAPGVAKPKWVWEESMAPSGLTFYTGESITAWEGQLFAGSLLKETLYRLEIRDEQVVHQEALLTEKIGRIRDVRQSPDGSLYLVTDEGDGALYRIQAAD
ncbi:MAG: PQQ-dependent sugar dehydrogenase [Lunatimonas sp.]|uniref:PQQ-dependent sugar dehydrogenase n=1 Tax=Lunatimonas sp. TaxID=2060141 RepID=UPI00263A88E6|nr:PQQ-dependent sugar dehydrogenase [Lunatimonas sp.]MCC5936587.1 PQQ-dependent sugar dehydrogenase [Lunatimonas sp.]